MLTRHGSALGDLFDYEDGGHVTIVTNLNENACDLNMKVANFKSTNMLACPQFEEDVDNLKEEVMSSLPPMQRRRSCCRWYQLRGSLHCQHERRLYAIATNSKNEVVLSFPLWKRTLPTGRRRLTSPLMLTRRMRWTTWKKRPYCH